MATAGKSEYANKLMDIEMKDAPKVKHEEHFGDKYNMSLMRELLKTKTDKGLDKTEKTQETMPNEDDKTAGSPLSKPTNPHPDPKRK